MKPEIDIVISWVEGEDEVWLREREESKSSQDNVTEIFNHEARYRDIGLLKYVLRSIDMYAPWVRNIYIVTPDQKPYWLEESNERVKVISQNDIIPHEFQPTFKSTGVEWHLHRIPGLSENFIYLNDDMLFNNEVSPEDFFINNEPVLTALYRPLPISNVSHMVLATVLVLIKHFKQGEMARKKPQKFFNPFVSPVYLRNLLFRSLDLINSRGSARSTYFFPHVALPLRKSTLQKIWDAEYETIAATCKKPFRDKEDVIIWLAMFWEIESGTFYPQDPSVTSMLYVNQTDKISSVLNSNKVKMYCINDSESIDSISDTLYNRIQSLMNSKYSNKSQFEK